MDFLGFLHIYGCFWMSNYPKGFLSFLSCVLDCLLHVSFIIFCPRYLWVVSFPTGFLFFPLKEWTLLFLHEFQKKWNWEEPCIHHSAKLLDMFSSVKFSHSVVSDSLWPHRLQHTRPPCPSPTPRVYPNSCPSSWRCHLSISSSAIPFSSHLQSFPASGSFPVSQLFTSGGQNIGDSASASVPPMLEERYTTVCG